ncbi:LOW QUALITY PROTEIN: hypothetical protein KUTeg_020573 [Tegillarca granosa]|uniref:Core-binding (CB) domain-containing protein n=1 Tax=Tegillarca granosa TaxID=220873 RepID=A0ABQ9ECP1_TEGGR|nr:LOW QUALITY PROTEIN: hypothetical protein KUTeg_020573 [Tegillarca granosa]
MAQELGISLENEKANNEFASYISDRLKSSKEVVKLRLPMDGSTIQALLDIKNGKQKARSEPLKPEMIANMDYFDKFCKTPKLDDNIEEGITQINNTRGTSKVVNSTVHRGKFKFKNKDDVPRNAELKKIDLSARLLLREISYGSLITSYLDKVVSDENKTEALQALVELFNSMADTTSRIIVGAVGARRNLYLKDLSFVNHATEAKLLTMSTVGPNIFLGRYFDMLHTSAENIRDARETQHLRSQISSNSSETYSKKRSREQSPKSLKPSSKHHKSDKSEDARPWKHSNFKKPSVMVSTASKSVDRHTKKVTNSSSYVDTNERSGSSSKSRKPKSGNLENFKHKSPSKKFSKKAREYISKSRRLSTQRLYHSRLSIYHSWCDQQNVLPDSATVEQMADFFIYLHEKRKLKAVTISGYRSAIATLHKGWNGSSVSLNKDLTNLIKGIFNSNPNIRSLLPNWDLPSVLLALCDFPFEPIYTCELKFLTWKTVFLLAVATASRVSELHALSVNSDSLELLPNLKLLAKSQRLGKVWNPLFIPQFDRFATDERDLLLCPCRSLKEYFKRTKSIRGQIENLFLTYQKGFCKAAAKTTLSRWIVSLIRYVYDKLPDLNLGEVRAHDTRRLATSWALFNGASVQSILQAAHWATETTFTSFYLKDVGVEDSFAKASLLGEVSAHNTRRLATSWALFYGASVQSILQIAYWTTKTTFTSFYLKDVGLEDRFAKASVLKTTNWAGERKKQTCSEDKH